MREHAIAGAVFVVFVLIGVWHGVGFNFFLFGVLHACAIVANQYYGLALRKVLGTAGLRAYRNSRVVEWVCIACTFTYLAATVSVFANDISPRQAIAMVRTLL
jgi:D-alanyl-lipoteichoic acid acyltransferase DltB (MBOAT superfamily)